MLIPPEHQVAGHSAAGGSLGPLSDGAGRFFKPLQSSSRGDTELSFYASFSADPTVPSSIRNRFFPSFHGTQLLPASDGSGEQPHLDLEDLTHSLTHPSIVDFKIGARTWPTDAPEPYVVKCLKKDRESTSTSIGFRVSGLQIYSQNAVYKPDRDAVRKFVVSDVRDVIRRFAEEGGVKERILEELRELKRWFEEQTGYHFYSASVLVMRGMGKDGERRVAVKLVDFAHVVAGEGVIDHNFLGGLCSLIKFFSEVGTDTKGDSVAE